jgi:acyl-CoA reductase-like NAD-dependent aldehyde dehydrogenase
MTDTAIPSPSVSDASSDVPVYRCFVNGEWRSTGSTFPDYNPYDGGLVAEVANCGREEAHAAVEAAAAAYEDWSHTTPATRAKLFLKAAEIVERRQAEIAAIVTREIGGASFFAAYMQKIVIGMLEQAASWVYRSQGEVLPTDFPGTTALAIRRPLGVVASFTPWNGPSVLGWRGAILPLVWGNTVVLKPSELGPISAGIIMAEVLEEAGFPTGTVNVITHGPGEVGPIADEFFENDAVRIVNFTGSVRTGRILAERAGRALKRSVMELGGYNPVIIDADVDIDYAVRVATFSAFFHQGQICTSARKIYVKREIHDAFLERFIASAQSLKTGDPTETGVVVGPLITPQAVAAVQARVDEAVAKGAKVLTGGRADGQVYEPTILANVPDDAGVACEETFGPVVIVEPVDDLEDAVRDTNRSLYGLVASILCRDTARAFALGNKIVTGNVHINVPTVHEEINHPGGVVRDSGWGRGGPHSAAEFTDLIKVTIEPDQRQLPI